MKNVQPKRGHRTSNDAQVPVNPLPAPNIGEANVVEPTDYAEQATWQAYRSSTAHAEPAGHLDRRGVRKLDQTGRKTRSRSRSPRRHHSTDKDE